jgi:hypothetical protein
MIPFPKHVRQTLRPPHKEHFHVVAYPAIARPKSFRRGRRYVTCAFANFAKTGAIADRAH